MNNIDVLQNVDENNSSCVVSIPNALPDSVYKELESTFPEHLVINTPPADFGFTFRYKSDLAFSRNELPPIWKDFFEWHTSQEYFRKCIQVFQKPIIEHYGEENYSTFLRRPVTVRNVDNSGKYVTDCQFVVHQPLDANTTTRPAHLDNPIEIYAGLFYMKKENDESIGGNLQLYKPNNCEQIPFDDQRCVSDKDIIRSYEFPYKPNSFVMFLNLRNSVHGVSPRIGAVETRRSINIIGEYSPNSITRMWK